VSHRGHLTAREKRALSLGYAIRLHCPSCGEECQTIDFDEYAESGQPVWYEEDDPRPCQCGAELVVKADGDRAWLEEPETPEEMNEQREVAKVERREAMKLRQAREALTDWQRRALQWIAAHPGCRGDDFFLAVCAKDPERAYRWPVQAGSRFLGHLKRAGWVIDYKPDARSATWSLTALGSAMIGP